MKNFLSFNQFYNESDIITEELSSGSIMAAAKPMAKYLSRKTGLRFIIYPQLENFKNSKGKGYGLRFISGKGNIPYSIRFNFVNSSPKLVGVKTVTFWRGKKGYQIQFKKQASLVQILPTVVNLIQGGASVPSKVYTQPADTKMSDILNDSIEYNDSVLQEGRGKGTKMDDPRDAINGILDMLSKPGFTKSKVSTKYGHGGWKLINTLELEYSQFIKKVGKSLEWTGTDKDLAKIKSDSEKIMDKAGIIEASVSVLSGAETYMPDADTKNIEENWERISFEKQLKHLRILIRMMMSGVSNGLFIAGRGGIGKTWNVGEELSAMGMAEGKDYYSQGSGVSLPGVYKLMFRYMHDLVIFDDSDSLFDSNEKRDFLKNATDTKKKRSMSYLKDNSDLLQDEEIEETYGTGWSKNSPESQAIRDKMFKDSKAAKFFEYRGKAIFISNLPLDKLDPDGALRTRGLIINIDPTDEEVYDLMEKIAPDMQLEPGLYLSKEERLHVVKLLREGSSAQTANFRKLKRGLNMMAGAHVAGIKVSDGELEEMISLYA